MHPFRLSHAAGLLLMPIALQAAFPKVKLQPVIDKQIQSPTCIAHAGDGSHRLFVCDQRGVIHLIKGGIRQPTPFLDVGSLLVAERAGFDERGLLGLAFHPRFAQVGQPGYRKFYLFYSATSPAAPGTAADPVNARSTLSEFTVSAANPDVADLSSERVLLTFDKPQFNHNGGQIAFGPDGFLYIGCGDGGSANDNNAGHTGGSSSQPLTALGNAQDLTRYMGKILRIDPLGTNGPGGRYGIPAANPFAGQGGGILPEIWAYGLRNPWRFSFDRLDGRLFCADVGQGEIEEIDIIQSGANYGWRNREGTFTPSFSVGAPPLSGTVIDPIAQYAHPGVVKGTPALPQIGVSITGGFVYRGTGIAGLQGKYIFGDYSQEAANPKGVLAGIEDTGPGGWQLALLDVEGGNPISQFIQTFGEAEDGEIYVGAKSTRAVSQQSGGLPAGIIYKLVPATVPQTLVLAPAKDNTIYSEGNLSNALGQSLFTGQTVNDANRRALLKFDLSSIPAGAVVAAATLELSLTKTIVGDGTVSAHRLTRDWGEATSQAFGSEGGGTSATAGDATWSAPFFQGPTTWTTPGGDFVVPASSSTTVGASNGRYAWTGLAADVQAWLADPASNFGWILKGPESATSAKQYASRHNSTAANRPALTVSYSAPAVLTRRQTWEAQYFFTGEFIDPAQDVDRDGVANLLEYAWDRDPKAATPLTSEYRNQQDLAGNLKITFRRDPRATDLTYRLEGSSSLTGPWSPLVTSLAGAVATGSIPLAETPAADHPPLIDVTATIAPNTARNFVRLTVSR